MDEQDLAGSIDLVWRSRADWSSSFTLFNAREARIPLLTYEAGFLGEFIPQQGIGATIRWDFSNVAEAVNEALTVDAADFERLLAERSWELGAQAIAAALEPAAQQAPSDPERVTGDASRHRLPP